MDSLKPPVLNLNDIQELIPHRPPFLWLDEVIELSENRILARKFVDPSLDVFKGHYPDYPILPGVIICEAAMQAGAVLIAHLAPPESGKVPVATRMNQVQFRKMVRPGDTIEIDVELTEQLQSAYFLKAKVTVQGETAVRLEFACAAAPPAA